MFRIQRHDTKWVTVATNKNRSRASALLERHAKDEPDFAWRLVGSDGDTQLIPAGYFGQR